MKFAVTTLALVLAATLGGSVFAADPAPAKQLTPQQQKMRDCSAQAGDKKGEERRAFMSTCLKGGTATTPAAATAAAPATPAKPMTQQEKMKACNVQASDKHLAGDARKSFMSTCLKGDSSAAAATH